MTAAEFVTRLVGVQKTPTGWVAFCPGHDDQHKRSLGVREAAGRVLVRCYAGRCDVEAIAKGAGVRVSDLFLEPASPSRVERRIVATYDYVDEAGATLYQVVRFEPKDFRQRRPDGKDGWTWSLGDVRRVPYRLPDLVEQERVYWVEGEKDVATLNDLGLIASTNQGGVENWRGEIATQLAAMGVREVVILPDHDAPGEKYAATVAAAFLGAGLRVKIVRLPDLPPKGDVSDWVAAGGTAEALDRLVRDGAWVTSTRPSVRGPVPLALVVDDLVRELRDGVAPRVATPFPSLNHFLVGGFAPGELIYLGARPGTGKTALGLEIARKAAKHGMGVLVVSREMVNLSLGRRLVAQAERIPAASLRSGRMSDEDWSVLSSALPKLKALPIWFADHLVSLRQIRRTVLGFADTPPLGLVIVDYLQLVRAPKSIRERRHQVEAVSKGLKGIAVTAGVPVLCLSSLSRPTKDAPNRRPTLQDLRESGELEHDADVVLLLHREPMQPETECIVAKNRDGRQGTAHLMFRSEFVAFDEVAADREWTG